MINLSKNIKRNQRKTHDRLHMSAMQAKFNKSCAKTGGGSPPKEPPNLSKELHNLGVDATEEQNITEAINRGM